MGNISTVLYHDKIQVEMSLINKYMATSNNREKIPWPAIDKISNMAAIKLTKIWGRTLRHRLWSSHVCMCVSFFSILIFQICPWYPKTYLFQWYCNTSCLYPRYGTGPTSIQCVPSLLTCHKKPIDHIVHNGVVK